MVDMLLAGFALFASLGAALGAAGVATQMAAQYEGDGPSIMASHLVSVMVFCLSAAGASMIATVATALVLGGQ
ncbi:MAG: hypothetical protein GX771_10775 [Halomonadaceae bacterium]|nr:hypothetical protein [Halomonadaceae bacterium]